MPVASAASDQAGMLKLASQEALWSSDKVSELTDVGASLWAVFNQQWTLLPTSLITRLWLFAFLVVLLLFVLGISAPRSLAIRAALSRSQGFPVPPRSAS